MRICWRNPPRRHILPRRQPIRGAHRSLGWRRTAHGWETPRPIVESSPPSRSNLPMPTVSIVLPTYNRLALLREAVDSVRAQTFGDWELIVADDGSDDGTA